MKSSPSPASAIARSECWARSNQGEVALDSVIARRIAAIAAATNGFLHLFVALIDERHEYIDEHLIIGVLDLGHVRPEGR